MGTHHDVLGVRPDAGRAEIEAAYRAHAKRHHPDAPSGDPHQFRLGKAARDALLSDLRPSAQKMLIVAKAARAGRIAQLTGRGSILAPIGVSLALAFAAACSWVAGDGAGGYNGALVALGWVFMLLAWRVFADRRQGLRNPVVSLGEAAAILALSIFLLVSRVAILTAVLVGVLALLAAAEWLLH